MTQRQSKNMYKKLLLDFKGREASTNQFLASKDDHTKNEYKQVLI